uniref:CSON014161 protein n=1 Tax=Culicoides sonorensis TaxID=179676 RepID=A0A336KTJ9_CULSO
MCFPLAIPKIQYFLCCVDLRNATIFLAFAQVLVGLLALIAYVFDTVQEQTDEYIFLTVLLIIAGLLGLVLLIGFNKNSLTCFAVYVWTGLAVVFIFGIRIFTSFAFDGALAGFNAILIFIICWYILATVNSFYVILYKDRQVFEQETVTSVHTQDVPLQDTNVKPMNT